MSKVFNKFQERTEILEPGEHFTSAVVNLGYRPPWAKLVPLLFVAVFGMFVGYFDAAEDTDPATLMAVAIPVFLVLMVGMVIAAVKLNGARLRWEKVTLASPFRPTGAGLATTDRARLVAVDCGLKGYPKRIKGSARADEIIGFAPSRASIYQLSFSDGSTAKVKLARNEDLDRFVQAMDAMLRSQPSTRAAVSPH